VTGFVAGLVAFHLLSAGPLIDGPIASVQTDLRAPACKEVPDKTDPNDMTYLVCPGVAGYTLTVRRVEAGRESIEVVDPKQRVFPLDYQEFITRFFFALDEKAEWRVRTKGGSEIPIALIVRIQAHESQLNPEKVTRSYLAVAKITPTETCVTDRIVEGTRSWADARRMADTAQTKPCVAPRPPMKVGGAR
jgi:hypothetical protein